MKSYIKNILSAVVLTVPLLFAGCKDDLDFEPAIMPDYGDSYFVLGALDAPISRVSYNELTSTFEDGDIVGVFALDDNLELVKGQTENVPYKVTDKTYTGDDSKEYKVLEPATDKSLQKHLPKYLFYYPYDENMTFEKIKAKFDHTVKTDQSEEKDYEKSDLLWTVEDAGSKKRVDVVLDHAMALITVTIDEVNFDPHNGAWLRSVLPTAKGVSLLSGKWDGDEDKKIDNKESGYKATGEKTDIKMFSYKAVSTGHEFRVAVPAQTLKARTQILKVGLNKKGHGTTGTFSLRDDLELRAGYNYRFRVSTKPVPIPDYGDDDSWVLDVLDPETGEPVGLLCREYIRYQPLTALADPTFAKDGKNFQPDQITHPFEGNSATSSPQHHVLNGVSMSSQCWVFYNLFPDSDIPDLSTGVIMRVIYDVRSSLSSFETAAGAWPSPHQYKAVDLNGASQVQGIYLTRHGHDWIRDGNFGRPTKEEGEDHDKNKYFEFFQKQDWDNDGNPCYYTMHGAKIFWHGQRNVISYLEMPEKLERVSNETADRLAHISIPKNGKPYVSYEEVDGIYESKLAVDGTRNKIGITFPHYLVDTRINFSGKAETIRYPLIKIGFNQFWMSKSLRSRTLNDGTPLELQQKANTNGVPIYDVWYPLKVEKPGYAYPGSKYSAFSGSSYVYLDKMEEDGCVKNEVPPLYNHISLDSGLIPVSENPDRERYYHFSTITFKDVVNYVGWEWAAKLMSSDIVIDGDNAYPEIQKARIDGLKRGAFLSEAACYSANICGMNLKPYGLFDMESTYATKRNAAGYGVAILLYSENQKNIDYVPLFSLEESDAWSGNPTSDPYEYRIYRGQENWINLARSRVYAQARFLIKFEKQDMSDKGASAKMKTRACTQNPVKVSRNIYVDIYE